MILYQYRRICHHLLWYLDRINCGNHVPFIGELPWCKTCVLKHGEPYRDFQFCLPEDQKGISILGMVFNPQYCQRLEYVCIRSIHNTYYIYIYIIIIYIYIYYIIYIYITLHYKYILYSMYIIHNTYAHESESRSFIILGRSPSAGKMLEALETQPPEPSMVAQQRLDQWISWRENLHRKP